MRFGIEAATGSIMAATRQALSEAGLGEDVLGHVCAGIGAAGA